MTDKEFNALLKRVHKLVKAIKNDLWLDDWDIQIIPCREQALDDEHAGFHVLMKCDVNWPYKTAYIRAYLPDLAGYADDHLQFVVTHELLHVVVNEMRNYQESDGLHHEERVVTHLTQIISALRKEKRRGGTPSA